MKILLIESDAEITQTLQRLLSDVCYAVDIATDVVTALPMVEAFAYDLLVLDGTFSGSSNTQTSNIQLCQRLREQGCQAPILVLVGQDQGNQLSLTASQISTSFLKAGADDAIIKPFDFEEFISRVQALLRRGRPTTAAKLSYGKLVLDPYTRQATYDTKILDITPKEYAILELLLRYPHHVFSADVILERVWSSTEIPGEETIRGHIKGIRKKISQKGAPVDFIKTIHRAGYRLNPVYESTAVLPSNSEATPRQISELTSANQGLKTKLAKAKITYASLRARKQELETAYQLLTRENLQLQTVQESSVRALTADRTIMMETISQLQQQTNQWKALFKQSQGAIVIVDSEGRYVDANPAACRLFGVSRKELLQLNVEQFAAPDLDTRQLWQEHLEQGPSWGEVFLYLPEGNFKKLESRAIAQFIPGRHLAVFRDPSNLQQVEQKVRERTALIDIAPDAFLIHDLDNRIIFWSQGAEQLYGWTADEVLGHIADDFFDPATLATLSAPSSLSSEPDFQQAEMAQTTKSGQKVLVASRWTLSRDLAGEPESLLLVNTEVTDKQRLQEQMYQAQRLENLGRLTGGVVHDLKNVLNPILGIAQLLRLGQPGLSPQLQCQVNLLEKSAQRGSDIVNQILEFSRGTEGSLSPVDVATLLGEVVDIVRYGLPKSIDIRQNFSPPTEVSSLLKPVAIDPTHFSQVLMNLCINAGDAMDNGGTLTIAAENVFVDETMAQTIANATVGDFVAITVADTGTGILAEVRDRIFDPFFTTKPVGKGTGLGLSTVLSIVKNCGGFLQLFSAIGQGTEVKVYLPATKIDTSPSNAIEVK
jgi:PAS domain S-box-containing protein